MRAGSIEGSLIFAFALVVKGVAEDGCFLEDIAFFAAGLLVEVVVAARFRLEAFNGPTQSVRETNCASVSSRMVSGALPQSISL